MAPRAKKRKPRNRKPRPAPTECYFHKANSTPNYKDVLILRRFISDRGKIIPSSRSGICAKHQRSLSKAIKNARYMALLPYTDRHAI